MTECWILGVELFGNATRSGWWTPSKAKYVQETDSEQVPWGKDEKNAIANGLYENATENAKKLLKNFVGELYNLEEYQIKFEEDNKWKRRISLNG